MNLKRTIFSVPSLAAAGIVLVGGALGIVPLVGIGIVVWIGAMFVIPLRAGSKRTHSSEHSLDREAAALFRNIRRKADSLSKLVRENRSIDAVRIVGDEAEAEVAGVVRRAMQLCATRSELARTLREVRSEGGSGYDGLVGAISSIDERLKEADEALVSLQGRFADAIASKAAGVGEEGDLRARLANLKGLGDALEEADEMIRGQRG